MQVQVPEDLNCWKLERYRYLRYIFVINTTTNKMKIEILYNQIKIHST